MLTGYYNFNRLRYIHRQLNESGMFRCVNQEMIPKTACFYGEKINFYIDTSDGVNEDLKINEYCGRVLKIIEECKGKPFLFFKAAYSFIWSQNIIKLAEENNGKVLPFFKWPFNDNFYKNMLGKRQEIVEKMGKVEKEYDIGYFCGLKPYNYPKPSNANLLISWSDHDKFDIPGNSKNTGHYVNKSRKFLYDKIIESRFKVLYREKMNYFNYIKESYKCKVVLNPPGVGEYTSRMFDQCFIGGTIVLRKTSYDQGHSWKEYLPEVDFEKEDWQSDYQKIIDNYEEWGEKALYYYEKFWTPQAIVKFLVEKIEEES